ncbi:MAG: acyl-CoA reductase, partial [Acidobacteriota bacterium]
MARDPAIVHLPPAGLAFAAGFLQARHLEHLISRELPHPDALSRFVCVGERKALRVLPRGLVCHWIAGNVPLLGLFSWALSAVVGNLNVLRPSSRGGDVLTPVLRFLAT